MLGVGDPRRRTGPPARDLREDRTLRPLQQPHRARWAVTAAETWHGTSVGYRCRRCRCDLCTAEHAAWHKAYRARLRNTGPLTVDPLGARRRLQALMAIGWPLYEVARRAGRNDQAIRELLNNGVARITRTTDT